MRMYLYHVVDDRAEISSFLWNLESSSVAGFEVECLGSYGHVLKNRKTKTIGSRRVGTKDDNMIKPVGIVDCDQKNFCNTSADGPVQLNKFSRAFCIWRTFEFSSLF